MEDICPPCPASAFLAGLPPLHCPHCPDCPGGMPPTYRAALRAITLLWAIQLASVASSDDMEDRAMEAAEGSRRVDAHAGQLAPPLSAPFTDDVPAGLGQRRVAQKSTLSQHARS